jgi:hypothetical protein
MRVYKIEYRTYEYQCGLGFTARSDYFLSPPSVTHVMANEAMEATDLLRIDVRRRIEIASIEYVCKVDIKK